MKVIINTSLVPFTLLGAQVARAAPTIELAQEEREPSPPRTQLGGYAATELVAPADGPASFDAHHLVMSLAAQPHPRARFAAEVEWEHGGTPVREGRADLPGEVRVEQATADLRLREGVWARAGVLLMPIGRYNLEHEAPAHDLTERPLVERFVIPSTWSEVGAGVVVSATLGRTLVDAQLVAVNGLDGPPVDGAGLRDVRGSLAEDVDANKGVAGRVEARSGALRVGLAGYGGAVDVGRFFALGAADASWRWRALRVEGELAGGALDGSLALGGGMVELGAGLPLTKLGVEAEDLQDAELRFTGRLGFVDTDPNARTAGDRARLALGAALRLGDGVVWKNELVTEADARSGVLRSPWQAGARARYVGSVAVLF